ncbi:hypothetical protein K7432_005110 [Basidiobolus ranarum]|uniref:Carrier domain-containing protein n=1 Tax=Basidiobolus ranarum TaxID=34480 RepID=A0ABR2W443_9FUNG
MPAINKNSHAFSGLTHSGTNCTGNDSTTIKNRDLKVNPTAKSLTIESPHVFLSSMDKNAQEKLINVHLPSVGIAMSEVEDILPSSPVQEGLIAGNARNSAVYHVHHVMEIRESSFDFSRIQEAWNMVIQANPILRTCFIFNPYSHDVTFLQIVLRKMCPQWEHIKCQGDIEQSLQKVIDAEITKGFPLGSPNIRLILLETGSGNNQVVISWHHAIMDTWSANLICRDLEAIYSQTPRPKTLAYRYFIENDQSSTAGEKKFWKNYLKNAEPCIFPKVESAQSRNINPNQIEGTFSVSLSAIKWFVNRKNISIFTLIRAAWAILLQKHLNSNDVIFGYIFNGRKRNQTISGIANIVGPCINTLPCRVQIPGASEVTQWLQTIYQDYITSTPYQRCSLQNIHRWAGLNSQNPLFSTIINYLGPVETSGEDSVFNLTKCINFTEYGCGLEVQCIEDEISYQLEFNSSALNVEQAESLLSQFDAIVSSLVHSQEHQTLDSLDIVPLSEKHLQTTVWNSPEFLVIENTCVHQIFEQHVAESPDKIAIQFEDKLSVSYEDLNSQANRLAHHLISLGVGAENIIPLCLDKSVNMIVSMLAILKSGAAYVPLDPSSPTERNLHIVRESNSAVVISTRNYEKIFSDLSHVKMVLVDGVDFKNCTNTNPNVPNFEASNLCYVLFTSGSTGTPKGVMLEHKAVVNFLAGYKSIINLGPDDKVLQFANYTFDASIIDIFFSLCSGSCICLASKDNLLSNLEETIRKMEVTVMALTPTVASLLHPKNVPSLRMLLLGGEMQTEPVRDLWSKHVCLNNGYGPTETTVDCTQRVKVDQSVPCNNIGRPFGGNKVYILSENLQLVPVGAIGELCVGGPQLARGYLNRPDLTMTAFIPHPLMKGERLYKTGDLGRFNLDGSVTILGRKDNQIKLNGVRIELEEIEQVLYEYQPIIQVSLALTDIEGKKSLVAFLCIKHLLDDNDPENELNSDPMILVNLQNPNLIRKHISNLRQIAANKLSSQMIPTIWVPLNKMPTNASGKSDRKSLLKMLAQSDLKTIRSVTLSLDQTSEQPRTDIESTLQKSWAEVLNIDSSTIGIHDSFYNLGGDSISAIRLSSVCRQSGLLVSVQDVLRYPTINQLAAVVGESKILNSIEIHSGEGVVALTPILLQSLEVNQRNENHFNQSWLLKVRSPINQSTLKTAIKSLVTHHDMLRARFSKRNGTLEQRVLNEEQVDFDVTQKTLVSVAELRKEIHHCQRSLNLETGPIFSFSLYDMPQGEQLLFMAIHHYVVDFVSWRIIWEDLELLLEGKECLFKSMPFKTWSNLLSEHAAALDTSAWPITKLAEPICTDLAKLSKNTVNSERSVSFLLDSHQTKLLFGHSNRAYRTEPVDIMLSSLAVSYCNTFGTDALTVGMEGHGREPWDDSIDISRTVGWFTCMYPVTIYVDDNDGVRDVLKNTKDIRKRIASKSIHYGLLRYLNKEDSSQYEKDLVQISFNYFGRFQQLEKQDAFLQEVDEKYKFDLQNSDPLMQRLEIFDVALRLVDERLEASITFSECLHQESEIQKWSSNWQAALCETLEHCVQMEKAEFTVTDFPLLEISDKELKLLTEKFLPESGFDIGEVEDIFPCSPIQEATIAGNMKNPSHYHIHSVYTLVGDFDFNKLENTWRTIIRDIPIIRTKFFVNPFSTNSTGTTCLQVVSREFQPEWKHIVCDRNDAERKLESYLQDDIAAGFPLGEANIRLALLTTNEGQHQMIVSYHHAIIDGWSSRIIDQYIEAIYNEKPPPPVLPYREFISYKYHNKQSYSASKEEYWKDYLLDLQPCNFPTLVSCDQEVSQTLQQFSTLDISISEISEFTKRQQITTATLLRAAWAIMLHHYTNCDDVVFGELLNGRSIPINGISSIVGPCINVRTRRIRFEEESTVMMFLNSIHEDYVAAMPYEDYDLKDLNSSDHQKEPETMFNTVINYQPIREMSPEDDYNTPPLSPEGRLVFLQDVPLEPTEYAIVLNINSDNKKIFYHMDYNSSFVNADQAKRCCEQFNYIVEALVRTDINTQMNAVSFVSQAERLIMKEWNTSCYEELHDCAHFAFESQVEKTPNNVAILLENNEAITYEQLNNSANQLAHHLISLGVGPETIVSLCLDKSINTIVAILAVLKAGGAYVPLDTANPVERNLNIIYQANTSVIVTTSKYQQIFTQCLGIELLLLDTDKLSIAANSISNPITEVQSTNLCYIIFTSGSTGAPKGVMLEHRNLSNYIQAHRTEITLEETDRTLQFANYTFDGCVLDIFLTISQGACLCVASKDSLLNNLAHVMNTMQITTTFLNTAVASLITPDEVPSLKVLMVGGEMLNTRVRDMWAGKVCLINAYGPTETTVITSLRKYFTKSMLCSNVGWPIGGNRYFILDKNMNSVPIGAVGELWTAGPQLARGYLNRPDLNAESFVSHRLVNGKRLYRTRDLARFEIDGSVIILGRKDNQIKLNGLRIELSEIEHIIQSLPGIKHSHVTLLEVSSETERKALTAFICFTKEFASQEQTGIIGEQHKSDICKMIADIRNAIAMKLPSYMIPKIWVPLTALPLTNNHKVDNRKLASLFDENREMILETFSNTNSDAKEQPRTGIERKLQTIWSEILHIKPEFIGVHDSFFHLGGDSVLAIKLASIARRQYEINITVQQLFDHTTIAKIANNINTSDQSHFKEETIEEFSLLNLDESQLQQLIQSVVLTNGIDIENIEDIYPCSRLQDSLIAMTLKDSSNYLTQLVYEIHGQVDMKRFQDSWEHVARINPILRTVFLFSDLQYKHFNGLQIVIKNNQIPWQTISSTENDVDAELVQILSSDLAKGITLGEPMMRFKLLNVSSRHMYCIWTIHHALYDGWSMQMIMNDFYTAYYSNSLEVRPPYSRYISYLQQQNMEETMAFWRAELKDISITPFVKLPSPHYEPQAQLSITRKLDHNVHRFAQSNGITIATVLKVVWTLILRNYTSNDDVAFGVTNWGRDTPVNGIEDMCGPCINTLPCRVLLNGDMKVSDLLHKLHKKHADTLRFGNASLTDIQKEFQVAFDTLVIIQNASEEADEPSKDFSMTLKSASMGVNFVLCAEFIVSDKEVIFNAVYDDNLIQKDDVHWIVEHYTTILRNIIEDSNTTVNSINSISPIEKELLTTGWNSTNFPVVQDSCIHQIFENQVRLTPNQIAIRFERTETATYSELNSRANQLAHHLSSLGVGPETMVPILLDKSVNMIVAMMAILKAGGAYVPMDKSNPLDRNMFILEEVKASLVITTSSYKTLFTSKTRLELVMLDIHEDIIGAYPTENLTTEVSSLNLCYVIFTSGSTGVPKGVLLEHRAVVNYMAGYGSIVQLNSDDRVLQFANYTFDASILDIFFTLYKGACICLASKENLLENLTQIMADMQITATALTTTVASLIKPEDVPSLKQIFIGGEMLSRQVRDTWANHVCLHNGYGPSETTVDCTQRLNFTTNTPCSNIGRPFGTNRIFILDKALNLVPIGAIGELCVSGAQLARGYLNRPDLTSTAFVQNPYVPGERLYKTGDLAKFDCHGSVEILGRKDNQVKLNGLRIELGEIEHILQQQTDIAQACVILAQTDPSGNRKALVAFVCFNEYLDNCEPTLLSDEQSLKAINNHIAAIRLAMSKVFPQHMIPSTWAPLNNIPMNSSGKTDRKKLEAIFRDADQSFINSIGKIEAAPPRTPTELELAKIWEELLCIDKVNVMSNFFHVGGNSLLVINLLQRIKQIFDISLRVPQIYQNTSLGQLSSLIDGEAKNRDTLSQVDTDSKPHSWQINWREEIQLDEKLIPVRSTHETGRDLEESTVDGILLTGATGFLGAFLLIEILQKFPHAKVYCVVRGNTEEDGLNRVRNNLHGYSLSNMCDFARIQILLGDIAQPRLGLTEEQFAHLGDNIDLIYHNGANVNFVYTYTMLKAANVNSVTEMLKMASIGRSKQIHFVSTLGVVQKGCQYDEFENFIEPSFATFDDAANGYCYSKVIAELILREAHSRGFQVSIYRPGAIMGDTTNGIGSPTDTTNVMLKGCFHSRSVPSGLGNLDITPVDFVTRSIVHMSVKPASLGNAFNLSSHHDLDLESVAQMANMLERPMAIVPYEEWYQQIQSDKSNPFSSRIGVLLPEKFDSKRTPYQKDNCSRTIGMLTNAGLGLCPELTTDLLQKYIDVYEARP